MASRDLAEAPIDQFGRYSLVRGVIRELMAKKGQTSIRVLDVGGYQGMTARFLADCNAKVTIVDLPAHKAPSYVQGSALELPFTDASFDYVVSNEVLEHLAPQDRERYVSEAIRVSAGAFIMTAPFAGENQEVTQTERRVNDVWQAIYKRNHRWLEEHMENGLPTTNEFEAILARHKLPYRKYGNNDLYLWSTMVSFTFLTTMFRPSGSNKAIQAFYNNNLVALEGDATDFYRFIYVIGKDAPRLPRNFMTADGSAKKEDKLARKIELITTLFIQLAKDIGKLKKQLQGKDKEIAAVSRQLEERIQAYDALVDEIARSRGGR